MLHQEHLQGNTRCIIGPLTQARDLRKPFNNIGNDHKKGHRQGILEIDGQLFPPVEGKIQKQQADRQENHKRRDIDELPVNSNDQHPGPEGQQAGHDAAGRHHGRKVRVVHDIGQGNQGDFNRNPQLYKGKDLCRQGIEEVEDDDHPEEPLPGHIIVVPEEGEIPVHPDERQKNPPGGLHIKDLLCRQDIFQKADEPDDVKGGKQGLQALPVVGRNLLFLHARMVVPAEGPRHHEENHDRGLPAPVDKCREMGGNAVGRVGFQLRHVAPEMGADHEQYSNGLHIVKGLDPLSPFRRHQRVTFPCRSTWQHILTATGRPAMWVAYGII